MLVSTFTAGNFYNSVEGVVSPLTYCLSMVNLFLLVSKIIALKGAFAIKSYSKFVFTH